MKQWIKLETSLLEDPRIQKLLDSNLRYEGLGIYIGLRLMLGRQLDERLHINQLQTMAGGKANFNKVGRVITDFDLFRVNGNGDVELRVCTEAPHGTPHGTPHDTPEPFNYREENRKEINKEIFENGNHDFDPRWD